MVETEVPYGYIYEIKNKITGKTYIGQRKLSLDKHWRQYLGSSSKLKNDIRLYGSKNFVKRLIKYSFSKNPDDLTKMEHEEIKKSWKCGKAEYNINLTPTPTAPSIQRVQEVDLHIENMRDLIISDYEKSKNVRKTANTFNLPYRKIRDYLVSQGIPLNHRNKAGAVHSKETKEKIRKSRISYIEKVGSGKIYKRTCPMSDCLKEFETRKIDQKFCSRQCSAKSKYRRQIKYIDKEVLFDLYWNQLMSRAEIGKELGVGQTTVLKYMKKHGIKRRTSSEALSIKNTKLHQV